MTTVLDETRPRARKAHRCDWCNRSIAPGEHYRRIRQVDDYGLSSWKGCAHCSAFLRIVDMWDYWGQPDEGIGQDSIADFEPRTFSEARWLVQWRRKWRRRDGALYPRPTTPADPERAALTEGSDG